MSYERLKYQCRHEDCEEAFLSADARNGHESVHYPDIIGVETP